MILRNVVWNQYIPSIEPNKPIENQRLARDAGEIRASIIRSNCVKSFGGRRWFPWKREEISEISCNFARELTTDCLAVVGQKGPCISTMKVLSRSSEWIDTIFASIFRQFVFAKKECSGLHEGWTKARWRKGKQKWYQSRELPTTKIVSINFEHLLINRFLYRRRRWA